MKLYHSLSDLHRVKKPIRLAAGFFDGVHLGHQAVIRRVIRAAQTKGGAAWIMTFDIHPLKLLQPLSAPPLLTSTAHKIRLLESFGVEGCVVLNFTRAMAELEPEIFIKKLVQSARNLRGMVVGSNWTFGKGGRGTPAMLKKIGVLYGFAVRVVSPVRWRNAPISSTRIRQTVAAGRLAEAGVMLGRTFSVVGTVVTGRGFGRRLGIPTANLNLHNEVVPPDGVYAIRALIDGAYYDGAANIGVRPTMRGGDEQRVLEVHLFDMQANLYHREVEVVFAKRIRAERRFATLTALKSRIIDDLREAKKILGDIERELRTPPLAACPSMPA